jgi:aryl-alcohol dehydrogenase-like predicted oxidoreductase
MTFGAGSGIWTNIAGVDNDQATRLLAMALEHGVNLIDTADVYSQGRSEEIVGHALRSLSLDESQMLVATKVRLRTGSGQNDVGLGRSHIMRSVETSLKRIGRDHIDLFQLHDRDALVPLDETLRVLDDLVTQGKVRHIGVCNFSAADLERAEGITSRTDRIAVASNQVHYSLTSRDIEHEIMPVAAANKMGLLVWSPLAGGYLSGKYAQAGEATGRRTKLDFPPVDTAKGELILAVLREVAGESEATPAQVVLAWLLAREQITSVIIGARTPEQLAVNLAAQNLLLTAGQLARLDEISEAAVPFPHWMQRFHDRDRICG